MENTQETIPSRMINAGDASKVFLLVFWTGVNMGITLTLIFLSFFTPLDIHQMYIFLGVALCIVFVFALRRLTKKTYFYVDEVIE